MAKDLRQFLTLVAREAGPDFYVQVNKPLKPELEPFIIQQKLLRENRYPVIYCPKIEGSNIPLVTGTLGSYELVGLALGMDPKKLDRAQISNEYRRRQADARPVRVIPVSQAPVKEVILEGKDIDLGLLPVTQHHELDSGRYIVIGCSICRDPDTGIPNAGVYRNEVKGKSQLSCCLAPAKNAAYIAGRYAALGKPMQMAIAIGHHPAVVLGAAAEAPLGINELELAGGFLGEPLEVTAAETVDLQIPAHAEIVIEGVIDRPIDDTTTDGPFAEYTWYYGRGNQPAYLMRVTAITMRKDAIYHDLDPAHPEHNLPGALSAASNVYNIVSRVIPTVRGVSVPPSGVRYHIYVSVKKRVQGEGKLAGLAALAAHPKGKLVVVVDEDVDVFNEQEVMWAIATRVVGDRGISFIPEATGEHLDPTAYDETRLQRGYMVTKVIIDATKPLDLPFARRITPNKELWDSMKLKDYLE